MSLGEVGSIAPYLRRWELLIFRGYAGGALAKMVAQRTALMSLSAVQLLAETLIFVGLALKITICR